MAPISKQHASAFSIGVALDGAGWHPAAWREVGAQAEHLVSAQYWQRLIASADTAGVDYVTIEDSLQLPSHQPFNDEVPARPDPRRADVRLDALLIASWVAPLTTRIGLIPTVTTTHTEPFHVATALQTLDHVSVGRAGWQLRISAGAADAAAFGRKRAPEISLEAVLAGQPDPGIAELLDEAAEVAEVARRLWDSWEDDAIIRDKATGRFLDRNRLHHIDFEGDHFSVVGPSIVPRSPQGQLPVSLLAHAPSIYTLAARVADLVFITPEGGSSGAGASRGKDPATLLTEVRAAERAVGRGPDGRDPLLVIADLLVILDTETASAADRLHQLEGFTGTPFTSDTRVVAGSAAKVAAVIQEWQATGVDGVRLRPLVLPTDLEQINTALLPLLRQRIPELSSAEASPNHPQLRDHFGLTAPTNQYATARTEQLA